MGLRPFRMLFIGFVSGHDFTGCGKSRFSEGDGLQPVHNYLVMSTALAAEGCLPPQNGLFPQPL
jgi:hypothetical protein